MKFKSGYLFVLVFNLIGLGHAKDCEKNQVSEESIFKSLEKYRGRHRFENCQVELHLCEEAQSRATLPVYLRAALAENLEYWVGDLLVTDELGKSIYMPIYGARGDFPNTKMEIENSDKHFSYFYKDKNSDPVSGFKEAYSLKINKQKHKLELTMETSRITRRNPISSILFPDRSITCNLN